MTTYDHLHQRLRELQARLQVRSWEYRQRHGSKGVWARIGRVLAGSEEVWAISEADAQRLEAEGREPAQPGLEVHPELRMYSVTRAELAEFDAAPLQPRLDAALLRARYVALLPFEPE